MMHQSAMEMHCQTAGDLQAVRYDFDAKLESQGSNLFDGKKVAKEIEQTFMVKIEKMNNTLEECLSETTHGEVHGVF